MAGERYRAVAPVVIITFFLLIILVIIGMENKDIFHRRQWSVMFKPGLNNGISKSAIPESMSSLLNQMRVPVLGEQEYIPRIMELFVSGTFSKFYRRHYELVSKFNVGLKILLHQGLLEPEFYGDLVYKFKKKM